MLGQVRELVDPLSYGTGQPHALWARLRRESPVHWCSIDGYPDFWAVTRHADVRTVSVSPERFSSRLNVVLHPGSNDDPNRQPHAILNTDPPEHRDLRALTLPYFKPRALLALEDQIRAISRHLIDTAPPELDFVTDFAAYHPLRMLCSLMGVTDEEAVLAMTNSLIGTDDPEYAALRRPFRPFLTSLLADRRTCPRNDLSSAIANSDLPDRDAATYLLIIAVAGHETTRSALAGGMQALLQNPDQLALLKAHPDLYDSAAQEIVRYTSPVVHFLRKATQNTELNGQHIKAGDRLMLFYPSANRDEKVFKNPNTFDITRTPNPHLAWGIGEHYCLGANLARMEIRILLEELIPRLNSAEPTAPPQWMASNIVCGIKHLPIRWHLTSPRSVQPLTG